MDNSHRQSDILFLPLSSAVAAMFPRQSVGHQATPTPACCPLGVRGPGSTQLGEKRFVCAKIQHFQGYTMTFPFPCPVQMGVMRSDGLEAQLHRYTMEKNLTKMEKLLRKGVDVDCINDLGQTPLFCAALMGQEAAAELLLQYRAEPNHRCEDWSTPVHAAMFSCKPWLLSCLLDSGGDIRLHDREGRVPVDWLEADTREHRVCEMTEFLKSCVSHAQQSYQSPGVSTSSKIFLRSPSMLDPIKPRGLLQWLYKKSDNKCLCTTAQCFGFGKVCKDKPCQSLGVLASIPVIKDSDLTQADDETIDSFNCGSLISMNNYSWKGSRVTVKQIQTSKAAYKDLLLTEQDYCSQLFHPHLLQLMAVSLSADLKTSLVFERVHVDSLHNLIHHKRLEFPVLHTEWLLPLLLQVCEGVLYLHSRGLVVRALSSHSIVLTHPGLAKLTGFGYMAHREGTSVKPSVQLDVPPSMYNWASPEVIRRRMCTEKADLYSLCTIIQEIYTGIQQKRFFVTFVGHSCTNDAFG
ncbi:Inactive serine/threonine-protein kinase TEX14 [Merluccius polli]|uniref:Inactive serine/threonine-protein kinase TEX14 n=1 Tax=Merluccius polli TaxID=89951 RepID=A0AA47MY21_MERPO|nr:Inactive serine/threonine-protein kinase TEX14 [Merluccius polli]